MNKRVARESVKLVKSKEIIKHRQEYFVSCPFGLEAALEQEMRAFGIATVIPQREGVKINCYNELAIKVLLNSRLASRVYKLLFSFHSENISDLYEQAKSGKWKSIFDSSLTFKIRCLLTGHAEDSNPFQNGVYISQVLKDAVVDSFRQNASMRPSVDLDHPDVLLLLRIDRADPELNTTISVDLCGYPLHQRFYRDGGAPAPVKENLAAGILKLSEWNPKTEPFVDLMCGSGTFPIEAALIKYEIPPTFLHVQHKVTWAFEKLEYFIKDKYLKENFEKELNLLNAQIKTGLTNARKDKASIFGIDKDPYAVMIAKKNLERAGLTGVVKFMEEDALTVKPETFELEKGFLFSNPHYVKRLGEDEGLGDLYENLGENLKNNFKNFRFYLFTGAPEHRKRIRLRAKSKTPLYNGPIDSRLVNYELF